MPLENAPAEPARPHNPFLRAGAEQVLNYIMAQFDTSAARRAAAEKAAPTEEPPPLTREQIGGLMLEFVTLYDPQWRKELPEEVRKGVWMVPDSLFEVSYRGYIQAVRLSTTSMRKCAVRYIKIRTQRSPFEVMPRADFFAMLNGIFGKRHGVTFRQFRANAIRKASCVMLPVMRDLEVRARYYRIDLNYHPYDRADFDNWADRLAENKTLTLVALILQHSHGWQGIEVTNPNVNDEDLRYDPASPNVMGLLREDLRRKGLSKAGWKHLSKQNAEWAMRLLMGNTGFEDARIRLIMACNLKLRSAHLRHKEVRAVITAAARIRDTYRAILERALEKALKQHTGPICRWSCLEAPADEIDLENMDDWLRQLATRRGKALVKDLRHCTLTHLVLRSRQWHIDTLEDEFVDYGELPIHKVQTTTRGDYTATQLVSSRELFDEGVAMHHCVGNGGYAMDCQRGRTLIYRIEGPERTTLELRSVEGTDGVPRWQIWQNKKACNQQPNAATQAFAKHVRSEVSRQDRYQAGHTVDDVWDRVADLHADAQLAHDLMNDTGEIPF